MRFTSVILLGILALFCVSLSFADEQTPYDPIEHVNRSAFNLNMHMDKYILKPAGVTFHTLVPAPIRSGLTNGFINFYMPVTIINDFLQGDFLYTVQDTWRFIFNSTIGIAGIVDVATKMGLPEHTTDTGITLAKWGLRKSPYLVVPFWGASTVVDMIGSTINYNLMSPYPLINPRLLRYGMLAVYYVNLRSNYLDYQNLINNIMFDPYVFQRNAYLQKRAAMLQDSIDHTWFHQPANTPTRPSYSFFTGKMRP